MIFRTPKPFEEALQHELVKKLLPTSASARQLETLAPQIRERARFAARVQDLRILSKLDEMVTRAASPETIVDRVTGARREAGPGEYMDRATFRLELRKLLTDIGYQPVAGTEGTIRDLTTERRLNVMYDTNVRMAHGYGYHAQGQDAELLDLWPCQELIREEARQQPRNWPVLWQQAGGKLYAGRMIALKDDPVWTAISRFGLPYPPFDYGSGMGVQDVTRAEAMALGVIDRDTQVAPDLQRLNSDASVEIDPATPRSLLQQVLASFGGAARLDGNRLELQGG